MHNIMIHLYQEVIKESNPVKGWSKVREAVLKKKVSKDLCSFAY